MGAHGSSTRRSRAVLQAIMVPSTAIFLASCAVENSKEAAPWMSEVSRAECKHGVGFVLSAEQAISLVKSHAPPICEVTGKVTKLYNFEVERTACTYVVRVENTGACLHNRVAYIIDGRTGRISDYFGGSIFDR
jgi:hypothetical protein